MKRLRKKLEPKKIRFYHCGEYGDKLGRPHYHALLFNHDFPDKIYYSDNRGNPLYTSQTLDTLWERGNCWIGNVTTQSAAYVARYIMKKINGSQASEHYKKVSEETGEIFNIQPEYTTMSRKPGIAHAWFQQYKDDVFPDDFIVTPDGRKNATPTYYLGLLKEMDPDSYEQIKMDRMDSMIQRSEDNTPARLKVREKCQLAKLKNLTRGLDNET